MAAAIQTGNVSEAQSAYANLQQTLQSNPNSPLNALLSGSSTLQNDFSALGQALQSGDASSVQSAFTQFQTDLKAARQSGSASTNSAASSSGQDQYVPSSQSTNYAEFVQQDYRQLAAALHTGNLSEAQSAFTNLEQALQTQGASTAPNATSTTSTSTSDPISNDLNTLGQALSSGNLNQAQSAFSQLNSDVKSAEETASPQAQSPFQVSGGRAHGHHHHHGGGGGETTSSTSATDSSDSSTTSGSTTELYG